MIRILKGLGIALLLLVGVIAFNTLRYSPPEIAIEQTELPTIDGALIAQQLSEAIQFKTISHPAGEPNRPDAYDAFLDWLAPTFPAAASAMERVIVGSHTLIYIWRGSDPSAENILISGHYDVVPIEGEWSIDPWAGVIKDDFVWGRGALDMKGAVIASMHALDALAASGFQPRNTIYFAITQDEEIGGDGGAASVVSYFEDNDIDIAWSLDEGSFVLRDIISTIDNDIASINVAEKGYLTVEIIARGEGGHSSLPQRDTAVTKLATAITELHAEPVPGGLTGLSADFFDTLGPHMSLPERALFANRWLFGPLI
ncbi:MAG: M20/M25/M40 family metallo-hydrolase, partial [Pseudomonadota bacterium]